MAAAGADQPTPSHCKVVFDLYSNRISLTRGLWLHSASIRNTP